MSDACALAFVVSIALIVLGVCFSRIIDLHELGLRNADALNIKQKDKEILEIERDVKYSQYRAEEARYAAELKRNGNDQKT